MLCTRNEHSIVGQLYFKNKQTNIEKEISSSVLCDYLEGWHREGGREKQEGGDMGTYVYVELIRFVIKQKLTHHYKAIILQ